MGDPQKEERECRLGSHRRAKVARRGSRRYCRPPRNFLFQFAINKSTTPLVNRLRLATASLESSVFIGGRKRTRKGRGRRKRWCNSVELKELKDASLLVSSDSPPPRLLYVRQRERPEREREKEREEKKGR